MKKIEIRLEERQTWVEEFHKVHITGYTAQEKAQAEKSIKKMLGWDEETAMEIKFMWMSETLCFVEFRYQRHESRI